MEEQIKSLIVKNRDQMIKSIKTLVQIPSVKSEAKTNMPYGEAIHEALEMVLTLAQEMGFETENVDGHMGIVKYGEGDDYVGVIGHLDVVEAGTGWSHAPFGAEEEQGRIYGRGILDNKGPIMTCLYALYAIKSLQIKLNHPIWILFGTDEESGFHDLMYYLTKKKPPIMGFTPDCKYPVVYAERGRCRFQVNTDFQHYEEFCEFVNQYLQKDNGYGKTFHLDVVDEEFGKMQMSNASFVKNDVGLGVEFSFSYPASMTKKQIEKQIQACLTDSLQLTCVLDFKPVRFEKDGFLCQTLKQTYESITGNDGTPVTTTGGTYAKVLPNIVPFGPSFPGQKGIAHLPDEWMDLEDIMQNAFIYGISLLRLASSSG